MSVHRRVNCEQWRRVQKSFHSVSLNIDTAIQACHSSQAASPSVPFQRVGYDNFISVFHICHWKWEFWHQRVGVHGAMPQNIVETMRLAGYFPLVRVCALSNSSALTHLIGWRERHPVRTISVCFPEQMDDENWGQLAEISFTPDPVRCITVRCGTVHCQCVWFAQHVLHDNTPGVNTRSLINVFD